ncbi:MAG: pilus assembly protein, partial [Anaerolineaceae bacterium]
MRKIYQGSQEKTLEHRRKSSKGQGIVEFGLILPALLLILVGISEFGRLLITYSSVATASRDAAR